MLSTSEVAEFVSGGSWFMVMLGGTQDHAQGVRATVLKVCCVAWLLEDATVQR